MRQDTGDGFESPVDERTRLLAPVGRDDAPGWILDALKAEAGCLASGHAWLGWRCTRCGASPPPAGRYEHVQQSNWDRDLAAFKRDIRIHGFPESAELTAVIPKVAPAQPAPIVNGEPYNDHPWCRKKIVAIGLLVGTGVVIGFLVAVVLFALAVS